MDRYLLWDRVLAWAPGLVLALGAVVLFRPGGVIAERQVLMAAHANLDTQVTEETAKNRVYEQKIEDLRSNPAALEQRAREDLGLVHPDDLVIRFTDETE